MSGMSAKVQHVLRDRPRAGHTCHWPGCERYEPMHMREALTAGIKISAGCFNRDARGRWYLNCPVEIACADDATPASVGIDLGLKDLAALSNGEKIGVPPTRSRGRSLLRLWSKYRRILPRARVFRVQRNWPEKGQ